MYYCFGVDIPLGDCQRFCDAAQCEGEDMALDKAAAMSEKKDLYDIGEMPPVGHLPEKMHAWAIRRERHGEPDKSFALEVVDVKKPDSHEVVVLVMAAGVNYNGVWAGLGVPISPFDVHKAEYHIAGSDASGIVWAVGEKVTRWQVGDEVEVRIQILTSINNLY